jgi:DNA-binding NtrC family response regulator
MQPAILLVDDDQTMLTLIHRLLQAVAPDYDLITARDGMTALARIAPQSVALVITDYHMPDMDGVALAKAIKVHAPQCPVILMTGASTLAIQQRAEAAGVDYFLAKPFLIEQLAPIVQAALAQERVAVA